MSECNVCYSPFSSVVRKKVQCSVCDYTCCSKCVRTYILHLVGDAKCMNCSVEWKIPFLYESISKQFVKEYKKHRRQYLFQKQLYLLPILSEYIEIETKMKNLQHEKKEFNSKIKSLPPHLQTEREKLKTMKTEVYNKIQICRIDKQTIFNDFITETKTEQKKKIIRERPCIQENCKGFLNKEGKCPICSTTVCLQCNVSKNIHKEHCDPIDIETVKEIQKNTRQCPSCSVSIFKISGCDQMWCTHCNTAFSWKSGTIITNEIHNPHYFDWLMENNETADDETVIMENVDEDLDIHNDTLPSIRSIQNLKLPQYDYVKVLSYYRDLQHLIHEEIPFIRPTEREYRVFMFEIMLSYAKKQKKIERNLENVDTNHALRKELLYILENFRTQQIHLFRGLTISKTISITEFYDFYKNNIKLYTDLNNRLCSSYDWYYGFQFQKNH